MERKKRLLQAGAFLVASVGLALAGREAVQAIDSSFTPRYVNEGSSPAPIDEPPVWTPKTDWMRNHRIVFIDSRDGKTIRP